MVENRHTNCSTRFHMMVDITFTRIGVRDCVIIQRVLHATMGMMHR